MSGLRGRAHLSNITHMAQRTVLNTREVAERLGISVPTVTRRARAGDLPVVAKMTGDRGAYVFDADAIETLLAETRPAP